MPVDLNVWESYRVVWLRAAYDSQWAGILKQAARAAGKRLALVELQQDHNQLPSFLAEIRRAVLKAAGEPVDPARRPEAQHDLADWVAIVNWMSALPYSLILVLAGYDLVESEAVHAAVAELLEYQPDGLQIVLFCRSTPPLPLARLRARRALMEVQFS